MDDKQKHDCPGCKRPGLGYMAWHDDAARRHKRGERQRPCPACGKWTWPEHLAAPAPGQGGKADG